MAKRPNISSVLWLVAVPKPERVRRQAVHLTAREQVHCLEEFLQTMEECSLTQEERTRFFPVGHRSRWGHLYSGCERSRYYISFWRGATYVGTAVLVRQQEDVETDEGLALLWLGQKGLRKAVVTQALQNHAKLTPEEVEKTVWQT